MDEPVQYKDGDIVWVKLGPCWWPGEVHDVKRVPPEIQPGFKKPPIAFVHFFQEDKYEYVKNLDFINHYNCPKKNEYIQKGLDMYRAKQKHMDKFPEDICTAERLTNGDPDIITSDQFAPQRKVNYSNIFGSPKNRKSISKRLSTGSGKPGRGKRSQSLKIDDYLSTPNRNILNVNLNYEKHDLSKNYDREIPSPTTMYDCQWCNFKCTRLNVIVYHHKSHIDPNYGYASPDKAHVKGSKRKFTPQNKLLKIPRCGTSTIDKDLELLSQGIDLCSYNNGAGLGKKFKSPKIKFSKTAKLNEKSSSTEKDMRIIPNLLADWDDSDSEKEDETLKNDSSATNEVKSSENKNATMKETSCFDFNEDEDLSPIISKSPGRKIPRVIPENQKTKASETIHEIEKETPAAPPKKKPEEPQPAIVTINAAVTPKLKAKQSKYKELVQDEVAADSKKDSAGEVEAEKLQKEFDLLMETSAVPEIPSLPDPALVGKDKKDVEKKSRGRKRVEQIQKVEVVTKPQEPDETDTCVTKPERKPRGRKSVVAQNKTPEVTVETQVEKVELKFDLQTTPIIPADKKTRGRKSLRLGAISHEAAPTVVTEAVSEVKSAESTVVKQTVEDTPKKIDKKSTEVKEKKSKPEQTPIKEKLSKIDEKVESIEEKIVEIVAEKKAGRGRKKMEPIPIKMLSETPKIVESIKSPKAEKKGRNRKRSQSPTKLDSEIENDLTEIKESEKQKPKKHLEEPKKIAEETKRILEEEDIPLKDRKSRGTKRSESSSSSSAPKEFVDTVLSKPDKKVKSLTKKPESPSVMTLSEPEMTSKSSKKVDSPKIGAVTKSFSEPEDNIAETSSKINKNIRVTKKVESFAAVLSEIDESIMMVSLNKKSRVAKKATDSFQKVLSEIDDDIVQATKEKKLKSLKKDAHKVPEKKVTTTGNETATTPDKNLQKSDNKKSSSVKNVDSHKEATVGAVNENKSQTSKMTPIPPISVSENNLNELIASNLEKKGRSKKISESKSKSLSESEEDFTESIKLERKSRGRRKSKSPANSKIPDRLVTTRVEPAEAKIENVETISEPKSRDDRKKTLIISDKQKKSLSDHEEDKIEEKSVIECLPIKKSRGRKKIDLIVDKNEHLDAQNENKELDNKSKLSENLGQIDLSKKSADFNQFEESKSGVKPLGKKKVEETTIIEEKSCENLILQKEQEVEKKKSPVDEKLSSTEINKINQLEPGLPKLNQTESVNANKLDQSAELAKISQPDQKEMDQNKIENRLSPIIIKKFSRRRSKFDDNQTTPSKEIESKLSFKLDTLPPAEEEVQLNSSKIEESSSKPSLELTPRKLVDIPAVPEKQKIIRKRGRPSNASRELKNKIEDNNVVAEVEEPSPEKIMKKDDILTDVDKKLKDRIEEKQDIKTPDLEMKDTIDSKSSPMESDKFDDSVKVAIPLNDLKIENISPITPVKSPPPPPIPSTSTSKRTPIKFEISKMKAQLHKKLTTHKSFLGEEDDDIFARKSQTFPVDKTISSLKRTFGKDFGKECESPKKRVMADYKKELDLEKSKKEQQKLETSSAAIAGKMKDSPDVEMGLLASSAADIKDVMKEGEIPEDKLTSMPLKHEDISAVINSGSEVKITDLNLEITDASKEKFIEISNDSKNKAEKKFTKDIFQLDHIEKIDSKESEHVTTIGLSMDTLPLEPKMECDLPIVKQPVDQPPPKEKKPKLRSDKDYADEFESIEHEIQKITSSKSSPSKVNSFPENIAVTPTKELSSIPDDEPPKDFYSSSLESSSKISSFSITPDVLASPPKTVTKSPTKDKTLPPQPITEEKPSKDVLYGSSSSESNSTNISSFSTPESEPVAPTGSDSVVPSTENSIESEIAKLTDTKPENESELLPVQAYSTTSSKLLEILESKGEKTKIEKKLIPVTLPSDKKQTFIGLTAAQKKTVSMSSANKLSPKTKFILKPKETIATASSASPTVVKKSKPIILSEEIIKPANDTNKNAQQTAKITTKRNFEEDIEDKGGIKKFIIEKAVADSSTQLGTTSKTGSRVKPTVLSQTIITSTGKIIGTGVDATANKDTNTGGAGIDDNMFDINSMPIVLSDDLLTPESIENMPIVISNVSETDKTVKTVQIINKSGKIVPEKMKIVPSTGQKTSTGQITSVVKGSGAGAISKNQKVYQTGSTKLLTNKPAVITQPGKPEKFIILPSSSTPPAGTKYTVGKRALRAAPQTTVVVNKAVSTPVTAGGTIDLKNKPLVQSGNKVMVVTNSQGQQSRIILSPAQQKMLGTKMGTKIVARSSPSAKGTTLSLNNIVTSKGAILTPTSTLVQTKPQAVVSQAMVTSKGQLLTPVHSQSIITSKGQILTPITPTQMKAMKGGTLASGKKIQLHSQKIILPASAAAKTTLPIAGLKTKTVLVKGSSQRQIIQKIQPSISSPSIVSGGSLRTVVQKSPLLKTSASPSSAVTTGKQKITITPKAAGGANMIKRQVIRSQQAVTSQSQPQQRIILQKVAADGVKSTTSSPLSSQRTALSQNKVETKTYLKSQVQRSSAAVSAASQNIPSLVPLSPSQPKTTAVETKQSSTSLDTAVSTPVETTSGQPPPKQMIIHDEMGNPTSITQGQILAVPGGEVVDGQPQSFMLVTVDESGNLLPLDNQALMALDPNLIGDGGNVMLQFNQPIGSATDSTSTTASTKASTTTSTEVLSSTSGQTTPVDTNEVPKVQTTVESMVAPETPSQEFQQLLITDDQQNLIALAGANQQLLMTDNQNLILTDQAVLQDSKATIAAPDQSGAVTYSISNAEDGQQIFISGDPEKAQHLINALASGSQDLSQIISNADGNLIINADGQHIILNADGANTEQIILATSSDGFNLQENYNPDFVTQVTTNQDILAAALANTVFPQESTITEGLNIVTSAPAGGPLMSTTSELSPSLYQNMQLPNLASGAVLETSLTNLAPIMSPLEVPTSGTGKIKVPLEIETSSQVPKSLELPITITDPNISQTVNSQLANELQNNLGLPITITDPNISNVRSSDLTTSTFGYSLPNIDDAVVTTTSSSSSGPISMPLLTEDLETDPSQSKLDDQPVADNKENAISEKSQAELEEQSRVAEELTDIFEPTKTDSLSAETTIPTTPVSATPVVENTSQPPEELDNSGNALDVLASVTTASGMMHQVVENNPELEQIFAEKKDDQLPANVFAQNSFLTENDLENKVPEENDRGREHGLHEAFSSPRGIDADNFDLASSHSDTNSDEISIQPSIVTDDTNSNKRDFVDGLENDSSSTPVDSKKFEIS